MERFTAFYDSWDKMLQKYILSIKGKKCSLIYEYIKPHFSSMVFTFGQYAFEHIPKANQPVATYSIQWIS